jgi:hypothetical protein
VSDTPEVNFREGCRQLEAGAADLRELLTILVGLVAAALRLPTVEPETNSASDSPPGLDEDARSVAALVQKLVGTHDRYWEVFDPRQEEHPLVGSLTDDVSEIYRDLRRGIHQVDVGRPNDALWEWRFSFETHWGNHATDAIRVLHRIVSD